MMDKEEVFVKEKDIDMPIKMFCKDANAIVMVYKFNMTSNMALIYNPLLAEKQSGNAWKQVKISKLIPLDVTKEKLLKKFRKD